MNKKLLKDIKEITVAVVIAVIIRSFIFQPFKIPSESMYPTMLIGDYLWVFTGAYGHSKHSFPYSLPLIPGRVLYAQPKQGDVAVFRYPRGAEMPRLARLWDDVRSIITFSDAMTLDSFWIKRIVGLPGDRIQVKKGILYINGKPLPQRRIEDFKEKVASGRYRDVPQFIETMPSGLEHKILRESVVGEGRSDNTREYLVPADHFFMMGDNRNNSGDSREGLSFVHKDYLMGRAQDILFSIDSGILDLYKVWDWDEIIRFRRFFTAIH